jgi:8-oxo-dGTP pyrophosphatase MutT (NUDIX family)
VPWAERLRWFEQLRSWIEPEEREAVRALVVDRDDRLLLVRYARPVGDETWWGTPGGGIDAGESEEDALRRELHEEVGLQEFELGSFLFEHDGEFPWNRRLFRQHNRTYLVRVTEHEPIPRIDLSAEGVTAVRWWSPQELLASGEKFAPADLPERVRTILGA